MRIYLGFDDTDDKDADIGTGRLVREFIYSLPNDFHTIGVVRHQLPKLDNIPFTSNNSSACAIIEMHDDATERLRTLAVEHLLAHCAPGSDPGLCVAKEDEIGADLIAFGQNATGKQTTQQAAMHTARHIELYGLGGTNDGIIGATAAVGLTKYGWCGRFIEYGTLRAFGESLLVKDLTDAGIQVISTDRDPLVPLPDDRIVNAKWIRPSLWGGHPVLQVHSQAMGIWQPAHGKRKKAHPMPKANEKQATIPYTA